jgi:hypothetical protein
MISMTAIVLSTLIGALSSVFPRFSSVVATSAAVVGVSCAGGFLAGETADAIARSAMLALLPLETGYMLAASVQILWRSRNESAAPCEEFYDSAAYTTFEREQR